jgi:HK97 family phage prohead protease
MTREHRTFHNVEVRATDEKGPNGRPVVSLRIIKPGVVDDYGSLWLPDTFDRRMTERMAVDPDDTPALCWSHDWADPIGHGIRYTANAEGPDMDFELDDFDAVPRARQADAQVRSKTIRDCSVGFVAIRRRPPTNEERGAYPGIKEVIEDADLDEVSLVLRGAVPGAKVTGIRAKRSAGTLDLDAVVEIARRKAAGEITHEEAQAAVDLLTVVEGEPPADPPPATTEVEVDGDRTLDDEIDSMIDGAVDGLLSRSGRRFADRFASDVDAMLREAIITRFDVGDGQWAWVRDHTDTEVVFYLEGFDDLSGSWRMSYTLTGNTVSFTGEPERVVVKTVYQTTE